MTFYPVQSNVPCIICWSSVANSDAVAHCCPTEERAERVANNPNERIEHIFHRSCLQEWAAYGDFCPLCHKTITLNSFYPVQDRILRLSKELLIWTVEGLEVAVPIALYMSSQSRLEQAVALVASGSIKMLFEQSSSERKARIGLGLGAVVGSMEVSQLTASIFPMIVAGALGSIVMGLFQRKSLFLSS